MQVSSYKLFFRYIYAILIKLLPPGFLFKVTKSKSVTVPSLYLLLLAIFLVKKKKNSLGLSYF